MNLKIILFNLVKLPILHLSTLKEVQLFDLEFAPDHFVDDADVGLDDFHYFGTYVFVYVVGDGDSVLAVAAEFYSSVNCLEERLFVDAGDDEVAFVDGLRALCAGTNTDSWEWVAHTGEKAAFFRKCAAIAHHCEGVHL